MRRYAPLYDLAAMQARVIERLEVGMTVEGVAQLPGFPSKPTLYRWGWADEGFAQRMARAQAWGRGVRQGNRNARALYDRASAEAFLIQVRLGQPIRRLVVTQGWPTRETLNLWKRMRPDFAADLAQAAREARWSRPIPFPYDEATADRIILACTKGERLRQVLKAPGMPSWPAVQRWRRLHPDFGGALRSAQICCCRVKRRAQSRYNPRLARAVENHVVDGGSLRSAGARPNLPCSQTLYAWMKTRSEFARRIERAQDWRDDMAAERVFEEALRIAAEGTPAEQRAALKAMQRRSASLAARREAEDSG
jgi:hypothetical protein